MDKLQQQWEVIRPTLATRLTEWSQGAPALAKGARISRFAALRVLEQAPQNLGKNARLLCTFFGLSPNAAPPTQIQQRLMDAVRLAWDGTDEQAELLLALMESAGRFHVHKDG